MQFCIYLQILSHSFKSTKVQQPKICPSAKTRRQTKPPTKPVPQHRRHNNQIYQYFDQEPGSSIERTLLGFFLVNQEHSASLK